MDKKTRVEILLDKLNINVVDNDLEFLECLIDLDHRITVIENKIKDV